MDEADKLEEQLLRAFSDYDQTVDIVSCWQAFTEHALPGAIFYRFGMFRDQQGKEVTPDFAIGQDAVSGKPVSPGSMICDVKKVPNLMAADGSDQDAQGMFRKIMDAIRKYGAKLEYVSEAALPKAVFEDHDVVLITPSEAVDSVYLRLRDATPEESQGKSKKFSVGRPLVLVEYFYSQANNLERYVFKWKQGEANSEFTNARLKDIMILQAQSLQVYPKHFIPVKIRHIICNDEPPNIYLLVFLWIEVFIKFLDEEDLRLWNVAATNRVIEIELTPDQIIKKLREEYAAPFSVAQIRRVLDELCRLHKAHRKDPRRDLYVVRFSNLAGRTFAEEEEQQNGLRKRAEFREYGRVFARLLANKQLKQRPAADRRVTAGRRRKAPKDYPTLFEI